MTKKTITALYDSREYANNAVLMLRQSGLNDIDVNMSPENAATDMTTSTARQDEGFWAYLENLFGGTEDHQSYSEGLRRGGTLVTVTTSDENIDEVIDILEEHGSVDLNEREESWRDEGWNHSTGSMATGSAAGGAIAGGAMGSQAAYASTAGEAGGMASPTAATHLGSIDTASTGATLGMSDNRIIGDETNVPRAAGETEALIGGQSNPERESMRDDLRDGRMHRTSADDVVQVVEEQLNVGKRAVNRGRVRIHSYVVETPVTENVTLHEERVTIERRPVDRPATAADLGSDAFRERTLEMDETHEEAVVGKTARVVEEIGLRKDANQRVETVSDTVRSTKVDIEDARTGGMATGNRMETGGQAGLMGAEGADYASQISENMEVVGSDGGHVGVIDHVQSNVIKLKKNDVAANGQHHLVPIDWVEDVDTKVMLKISANDARNRWEAA